MQGKGLSSLIPKKDGEKGSAEAVSTFSLGSVRKSIKQEKESLTAIGTSRGETPVKTIAGSLSDNLGDISKRSHRPREESVFQIEVEKIKPNPYQPRRHFNEENLKELAYSIRSHGILQPLVVSKIEKETETGTDVEYQLIAGERRLMAAKLIGLERVPAIIRKIDSHRVKLELALIENIQRSNLNPIETARAYARLYEEFNLTQQEIGVRVGKSREAVANTMRLLKLPSHIQEALSEGQLNESQARNLLTIEDPLEQEKAFRVILADKLSVRELQHKTFKSKISDPQMVYWEKELEEKIGAPVKLIKNGPGGKIVIHFHSQEEWQNILDKILGPDR